MWGVRQDGTGFTLTTPDEFATFEDLRRYARDGHGEIRRLLDSVTPARLEEPIRIRAERRAAP